MATGMSQSASVSFRELEDAFEFVSVSNDYEHRAYICIATGRIYFVLDLVDVDDDTPEGIEDSDQYISVPHKNDLNLGKDLVFSFAAQEMPDDYDDVRDMFRRQGAYRRFKDLLDLRNMLEQWYAFEEKSTKEALRAWCEEYEIPLRPE